MSLRGQSLSTDRATTEVQEAYEYFNRLRQTYPDSPYAKDAEAQMAECRKIMAEHELYIADVFWHMNNYGSAWRRYEFIAENYADVPEVSDHAREKAQAAYLYYREDQANTQRQKREGSWKNWFKWL